MSTIINTGERSVLDLVKLTSYAEMTDEEINRIIEYKIDEALKAQEVAEKAAETIVKLNSDIEENRLHCEESLKVLQSMCVQRTEPIVCEIKSLEFNPMEFGNE